MSLATRPLVSRTLFLCVAAMIVCWFSGQVHFCIRRITTRFLSNPTLETYSQSDVPPLHIVMLTYPRSKDLQNDFMIDSIGSYIDAFERMDVSLPWSVSFTVYGHRGLAEQVHPAFGRAKVFFESRMGAGPKPNFYMHPQTSRPSSHYAHLADALRYAYDVGHEWTMVVEDDFMLCGMWGLEGIVRVMDMLGSSLVLGDDGRPVTGGIVEDVWNDGETRPARWRGAFVGTGGRYVVYRHRECTKRTQTSLDKKRSHTSPHYPPNHHPLTRIRIKPIYLWRTTPKNPTRRPHSTMSERRNRVMRYRRQLVPAHIPGRAPSTRRFRP